MEKYGMINFRCKHCHRSTQLLAPVCLNCGTSRPATRRWHAPVLIALLAPVIYGLLMRVLS